MDSLIPIILAILGSGGFLGGIYALLKLRPEAGQLAVLSAQGAVIVQGGVLDSLNEENVRLRNRLDALEAECASIETLRRRIDQLEAERAELRAENAELRARIRRIEQNNGIE